MPYDVTGYDSAGVLHTYEMTDDGTVTAHGDDDLLTGWLGENSFEKPEPVEGEPAPESGELTPSQLEALRQHLSKLLTNVQIAKHPEPEEGAAPTPTQTSAPTTGVPAPEPDPTPSTDPNNPYPPGA